MRRRRPLALLLLAATGAALVTAARANVDARRGGADHAAQGAAATASSLDQASVIAMHADPTMLFKTGGNCMPCHNSLMSPAGEDVSIGTKWRATIMANSSRDPYWQASVRRETIDHPTAVSDIEDECSVCHMPMARTNAHANGRKGTIFAHLPVGERAGEEDLLAQDGVSCTVCHQIQSDKLGTRESFVGGYVIAGPQSTPRPVFGPFEIDRGLTTVMRSSSDGFQPTQGLHIRQAELCATCHTLITKALDTQGRVIGELPEQVMYQEWQHSTYPGAGQTCQSCHMPRVETPTAIASVLGQPRDGLSRHVFVGGNFFLLRMLNKYRRDLGVAALAPEIDASAAGTVGNLRGQTAAVSMDEPVATAGRLNFAVEVRDLAGHKFPTGYPARRAWLHVTVHDRSGRVVFESGAIRPTGQIDGNDNDADATKFEPHYSEIREPAQVQIYESIMGDSAGVPTTGLLTAVRYLKDNRLLPRGFDKRTADAWTQVVGGAHDDDDFSDQGDRVRYSVDIANAQGPFDVDAELRFQPIGFRWAMNLRPYDAPEPKRFVGYYESMSAGASEIVASAKNTSR